MEWKWGCTLLPRRQVCAETRSRAHAKGCGTRGSSSGRQHEMTNPASAQTSPSFPTHHACDPVHPLMETTTANFAFEVAVLAARRLSSASCTSSSWQLAGAPGERCSWGARLSGCFFPRT